MAGKVSASLSFMHPMSTLYALSSTCVRAWRENGHASVSVHRLHARGASGDLRNSLGFSRVSSVSAHRCRSSPPCGRDRRRFAC
eukprot:5122285-Prymnesium_polylepis.1